MQSKAPQCFEDPPQVDESHQTSHQTADNKVYPETVRKLLEKCKRLDLSEHTVEIREEVGHGGTSDLYIGCLTLRNGRIEKIAVKKLRTYALRQGNHEKASRFIADCTSVNTIEAFSAQSGSRQGALHLVKTKSSSHLTTGWALSRRRLSVFDISLDGKRNGAQLLGDQSFCRHHAPGDELTLSHPT